MELLRGAVCGRYLTDGVRDEQPSRVGIMLIQIAPGELDVLAVAEAASPRQDLVQDRIAGHGLDVSAD